MIMIMIMIMTMGRPPFVFNPLQRRKYVKYFDIFSIFLVTFITMSFAMPIPFHHQHQNDHNSHKKDDDSAHSSYHNTDHLLSTIRQISADCPYADAEWTVVTSTSNKWKLPMISRFPQLSFFSSKSFSNSRNNGDNSNSNGKVNALLTITITHNAKARNAARRAGGLVAPRTAVVSTFGEHGRERITSELALRILQRVCSSVSSSSSSFTSVDDKLLQHTEFVLIPVVNEQGRRAVEAGHECWRLNARGVDLNRNYLRGWGMYDNTTVKEEERCGHAPLSEYEARAVDAIVRRMFTRAYISVHSGDVAVLPPWDGHDDDSIDPWIEKAAKTLARKHCGDCIVGRATNAFGYRAYGTGVDHMHSERNVPLALTIEVYGGDETHCKTMFNPTTQRQFENVMANWSSILHTVAYIVHEKDRQIQHQQQKDHDSGRVDFKQVQTTLAQNYFKISNTWSQDGYTVTWEHDNYNLGDDSQVTRHMKKSNENVNRVDSTNSSNDKPTRIRQGLTAATLMALSVPVARVLRQTSVLAQTSRWKRSSTSSSHLSLTAPKDLENKFK